MSIYLLSENQLAFDPPGVQGGPTII